MVRFILSNSTSADFCARGLVPLEPTLRVPLQLTPFSLVTERRARRVFSPVNAGHTVRHIQLGVTMNTVARSIKKARRRIKGLDSLKAAKQRLHRRNRRRAKQLLNCGCFNRFEPARLTERDLS